MKNKLLSIGEISKITGTHIKSLRYYDQIGVLKPAYIDPSSSYRYYTYQQIGIVEAIRACIELGIPLKKFFEYTEADGSIIHYARLIEDGKKLAEEKVKILQENIKMMELYQREVERCANIQNRDTPVIVNMPIKKYYILPVEGIVEESNYYEGFQTIYHDAALAGYKLGYERGKLFFYDDGIVQRYNFVCVISAPKGKGKNENVISLPKGYSFSKCVASSRIEKAAEEFPDLFAKDYKKIITETEMYFESYDIIKSSFELTCSLPDEDII